MMRAEDFTHVTWRCIHFVAAGELSENLRPALEAAGMALFDIGSDATGSKDELLRALAEAMRFPEHFGMNWDAVIDCLRDLEERIPAEGYVLFIHAAERHWRKGWPWMGEFVEVWLTAAEESAHDGIPLHLVFIDSTSARDTLA